MVFLGRGGKQLDWLLTVLNIQNTDQISRPAPEKSVKNLQNDPRKHPQLRERVGQSQQNLSHLQEKMLRMTKSCDFLWNLKGWGHVIRYLIGGTAEPSIIDRATMPQKALESDQRFISFLPLFFSVFFLFCRLIEARNDGFLCTLFGRRHYSLKGTKPRNQKRKIQSGFSWVVGLNLWREAFERRGGS